jgi:sialate O-acetylesterase
MRATWLPIALSCLSALSFITPAMAGVRMPAILGHNMVLQRGQKLPIWGWAEKGETVTVALAGQLASATADEHGRWKVTLKPIDAPEQALEMKNTAPSGSLTITNILVGEVWVTGGQSNMGMVVHAAKDAAKEGPAARWPKLRLFTVYEQHGDQPLENCKGWWFECNPHDTPWYSAITYYFGRMMHQELQCPVGMICTALGGTPIQSWTRRATLERLNISGTGDLYNGMVAPLSALSIRGVLWYQGEGNVTEPARFAAVFPELIRDWRETFGQKQMPFFFVQVAPCRYPEPNANLMGIWDAQLKTFKRTPNTGMVVTTDLVDDLNNVHPVNKLDVARRLGRWALTRVYGRNLDYSGPVYQTMSVAGNKIQLAFDFSQGLKAADGQPLRDFTIAGADRKFVPARAEIKRQKIVVSSDQVARPVAVRFGWHMDATPNLVNRADLPASPFRTDNWE